MLLAFLIRGKLLICQRNLNEPILVKLKQKDYIHKSKHRFQFQLSYSLSGFATKLANLSGKRKVKTTNMTGF